jgi:hypothetical protein
MWLGGGVGLDVLNTAVISNEATDRHIFVGSNKAGPLLLKSTGLKLPGIGSEEQVGSPRSTKKNFRIITRFSRRRCAVA